MSVCMYVLINIAVTKINSWLYMIVLIYNIKV